jgi:hypothetical protein
MKTLTKFTAAALLAIAASAPAFAKDGKMVRHPHTMSQVQQSEATGSYAFAPATRNDNDPAAYSAEY